MLQARAVHQDVGLAGQRRGVEVGGQVHLDGLAADAFGDRGSGVGVEVGDHHGGPLGGQPDRARLAYAAGPASDKRHPPAQFRTQTLPFMIVCWKAPELAP